MPRSGSVLTAMAVAYPLVNHLGIMHGIQSFGLLWLSLALVCGFLFQSRSSIILVLSLLCLGAALISYYQNGFYYLNRIPPVIIAWSMAWIFGQTLLPGRIALISQIVERVRGQLPVNTARYCRRLTWVWTIFLLLMGVECAMLGLFASDFWWSLFTNCINYGLITFLFVIEFPIRRLLLGDLEHPPFFESLRSYLRVDLR